MSSNVSEIGIEGNLYFDEFAWKLAGSILEDFKPFVSEDFHNAVNEALASRSVEKIRALTCGGVDSYQPYHLKTTRQICDLFKKFSFSADVYTPQDLIDDSTKKFMDNQERLNSFSISDDSVVKDIIFRARGHVDRILGYFSSLEVCREATFGKKSSVGVPMRKACEGQRFEAPISGSRAHIDWFQHYYSAWNRPAFNYANLRAVDRQIPPYVEVDALEAVLVDKTWKSLRMIMPNTTLGTLYSSGLGKTIEGRLREAGFDIRSLQALHGDLARLGSITGSLVTADQSMASDNITEQLVDRLFSVPWADALKFGRIGAMKLNSHVFTSKTFCTMGIGFTFPLQTLVFLALLLAIRDYCGLDETAVVSVYGDDLIYDLGMHETVMSVFPLLGLVMNVDKTFATGRFRESCGFDFYRGIDVRPFHLGRAPGRSAGKRRSEAYLYTAFNSLRRRWTCDEVPAATRFIIDELRRIRGSEPLVVPLDYPDTSGLKLTDEDCTLLCVERKYRSDIHGTRFFRYLGFIPNRRFEDRGDPYLYLSLRRNSQCVVLPCPHLPVGHGEMLEDSPSILKWEQDPSGRTTRSSLTGKRYRRLIATIPEQDSGSYKERPGVTFN